MTNLPTESLTLTHFACTTTTNADQVHGRCPFAHHCLWTFLFVFVFLFHHIYMFALVCVCVSSSWFVSAGLRWSRCSTNPGDIFKRCLLLLATAHSLNKKLSHSQLWLLLETPPRHQIYTTLPLLWVHAHFDWSWRLLAHKCYILPVFKSSPEDPCKLWILTILLQTN